MEYLSTECAATSVGPGHQLLHLLISTLLSSYCAISPKDKWPKDYGPTALKKGLDQYDFVVVGAGSAGSAVAARLSENPEWNVLLIEAGAQPPIESEVPQWFFAMQHTPHDWGYKTQPSKKACLGMRNATCYWPRGKLLGGSSGINGMLYVRGNREDFDNWEKWGNPTWGWEDVKKYFKKSEDLRTPVKMNEEDHAKGGPLVTNHFESKDDIRKIFLSAVSEQGIKTVEDFNDDHYLGYGNVLGTIDKGRRYSSAKAYLIPAKDRKNLHVLMNAQVKRVHFNDEKKAVSVTLVYNGTNEMTATVKKEIVLSAGAVGTPQILMLSGVGPRKHLEKKKISVVKELPVGNNLEDHLIVPVVFRVHDGKSQAVTRDELMDSIYNYLMNRTSTLAHHYTLDFVGFINTTHPTGPYPDIELHHFFFRRQSPEMQFYLSAVGFSERVGWSLIDANQLSDLVMVYVVLLKPKSKGKIRLATGNYEDFPKIDPNYLDKDEDLETLLRGVKFQASLESSDSFKKTNSKLVQISLPACKAHKYKSDDYWRCYIRHMSTTVYHPTGTAKMGPDTDKDAVVDPRLNVRGIKGLRVADASVMPSIVSANTNAASIMIGEKVADFIKEDWTPAQGLPREEL